jgi:hypothetical protein
MLLEAGQHSEIALIQHRTAIYLDVAGASALLLFGSTVMRHELTVTNVAECGGMMP